MIILLVEDNFLLRKMHSAALRAHGDISFGVEDEREAVEQAGRSRPLVAVTGISSPNIDGLKIVAQMRRDARTNKMPILAVSAGADRDHRSTWLSAGAGRFQAKPTSLRTFRQNIGRTSGRSHRIPEQHESKR